MRHRLLYQGIDMHTGPVRFFDCFTDVQGGGNPVAIVTGAETANTATLQAAARDIGVPATCFLGPIKDRRVHASFFSPRTEYTMCGHAVIGLFTMLLGDGKLPPGDHFTLITPHGTSPVYVESQAGSAPTVMLDLPIPSFSAFSGQSTALAEVLKVPLQEFSRVSPVLLAKADFVHLLVPMTDSLTLSRSAPSFPEITEFCRATEIESIALFSLPDASVHNMYEIREFCPAIGVDESAAAGTTNASVSCYLAEHGFLTLTQPDLARTTAHQGALIGRPSIIRSEVRMKDGRITTVHTGGTAVESFVSQTSL